MASPHTLTWTNPTTNTDGTPYGAADNAGYEIALDSVGAVGIPLAYGTSFDLGSLAAFTSLKSGLHSLALRVVSKQGVTSEFSAAVTFPVIGTPMAPTNLAMA
jgi:hypothetical protein